MSRMLLPLAVTACLLPWNALHAQEADSAIIKIHVPTDATVSINGREYEAGGSSTLELETRLLEAGMRANYDISARVYRNGQWIADRITVSAQGGNIYDFYPELEPVQTYVPYPSYGSGYSGGYAQGGGYFGGYQGGAMIGGFQGGGIGGVPGMGTQLSGNIPTTLRELKIQHPGTMGGRPGMMGGRSGMMGGRRR